MRVTSTLTVALSLLAAAAWAPRAGATEALAGIAPPAAGAACALPFRTVSTLPVGQLCPRPLALTEVHHGKSRRLRT